MKYLSIKRISLLSVFLFSLIGLCFIFIAVFRKPNISFNVFNITNFFSFFSNQSSAWVCIYSGYLLFKKDKFSKLEQIIELGILINVSITFIIYQVIFTKVWSPGGLEFIGNLFTHTITPLLFIIYWLIFKKKEEMKFSYVIYCMLYPIIYVFYSIVRGLVTKWYPYPFFDIANLHFGLLLASCLVLTFMFIVAGIVFVGINNSWIKARN